MQEAAGRRWLAAGRKTGNGSQGGGECGKWRAGRAGHRARGAECRVQSAGSVRAKFTPDGIIPPGVNDFSALFRKFGDRRHFFGTLSAMPRRPSALFQYPFSTAPEMVGTYSAAASLQHSAASPSSQQEPSQSLLSQHFSPQQASPSQHSTAALVSSSAAAAFLFALPPQPTMAQAAATTIKEKIFFIINTF